MKIRIFTDGACSENPGPGGWAAVFNFPQGLDYITGYEKYTTNNRMELKAVLESFYEISKIKVTKDKEFELFSDSAYVVNSLNNGWVYKWKRNGWKTTKGAEVKNKDLWEMLIRYINKLKSKGVEVKIIKIKGHSGDAFNELVDQLAKSEVERAKEGQ